ncbi:hypothetical protein DFR75_11372 [Nocardia ignorata]|uniref:Sodium bile acid symporter family protein n=1 Tax=Nocardia ignorata TaxID=145285 RepID=A0A4R6NZB2_NOCIG|nr:hypothetical protein DFR75_11372 [Nocardia ignorata]
MSTATTAEQPPVVGKLSTLHRFLPLWIGAAMPAGILVGRMVPGLGDTLGAVEIDGVSLPIAIGLLIMMYPVLAKVRYDRLDTVTGDRELLIGSLLLNCSTPICGTRDPVQTSDRRTSARSDRLRAVRAASLTRAAVLLSRCGLPG